MGATGYTGAEVIRLLQAHPSLEVVAATSTRHAGDRLNAYCPWLDSDLVLCDFADIPAADILFLCQDVQFGLDHLRACQSKGKVIDLSPAFRLSDATRFESTYKLGWQGVYPYGLPEIGLRESIAKADAVANPGCHAAAAILALYPLAKAGWIGGVPVVDSKTGMSGAGRSKQETYLLYAEHYDNFYPYAVVGHRHIPEIEEHLKMKVRFTPHLLPLSRGIEATAYVPLNRSASVSELRAVYEQAYGKEPFIRLVEGPPSVKQVHGSNRCDICVMLDEETHHAVVMTALDNLVKGASGQAIQNANLMLGLPETAGLTLQGVWP